MLNFIETKDSKGHIKLYKSILNDFMGGSEKVRFITSENYACHFNDVNQDLDIVTCSKSSLLSGKVIYRIQQIYLMILALRKCSNKDDVFFLSYDTVALWFSLLFFNFKKIYVFEHNNIDQLKSSYIKLLFYRLLSRKVTSYVFEDYIGANIKERYCRDFKVYQHPLFKVDSKSVFNHRKKYIFLPSSDVSSASFNLVYEFAKYHDLDVITKKHAFLSSINSEFVFQHDYFENYDAVFDSAEFVAVVNDFNYRVSGVFYEAVANSKNIIMNRTPFSEFVFEKHDKITLLD